MACLKNKKKFLWWGYNGDHKFVPFNASVFMTYGDIFEVYERCEMCGCENVRNFVRWEQLLEIGMTNEEIKEIQANRFKTHNFPQF